MSKCKIVKGYHPKLGEYTYCVTHQDWLEWLFSNDKKPLPKCVTDNKN